MLGRRNHPGPGPRPYLVGQLPDALLHVARALVDLGERGGGRGDAGQDGPPDLRVRVVVQNEEVR